MTTSPRRVVGAALVGAVAAAIVITVAPTSAPGPDAVTPSQGIPPGAGAMRYDYDQLRRVQEEIQRAHEKFAAEDGTSAPTAAPRPSS